MKRGNGDLERITWTPSVQKAGFDTLHGVAELSLKGQDRIICLESVGVFGVFDGMGGHGDADAGAIASSTAAGICKFIYTPDTGFGSSVSAEKQKMRNWLRAADDAIVQKGEMGTTAIVLRLLEEGEQLQAVWANIGDSRLYLLRDQTLLQVSRDEGSGHYLNRFLGMGNVTQDMQMGTVSLQRGDQLMLCSDGITGDYASDILTDEQIIEALGQPTAREAARTILDISRKRDDKSVIVLSIGEKIESSAVHEHRLAPTEIFTFDTTRPLELRGAYNVVAQITVANNEMLLLDVRPAPVTAAGERVPFGESVGSWNADFLLVDETFYGKWGQPIAGQGGYKGILPGDNLAFGRNHNHDRFQFPDFVSRDHFGISYDGESLSIGNHEPTSSTTVKTKY